MGGSSRPPGVGFIQRLVVWVQGKGVESVELCTKGWREAGPPNDLDDQVDLDQKVVNKEVSR